MNNKLEFQCKNRKFKIKRVLKRDVEMQLICQRGSRAPHLISFLHAPNAN